MNSKKPCSKVNGRCALVRPTLVPGSCHEAPSEVYGRKRRAEEGGGGNDAEGKKSCFSLAIPSTSLRNFYFRRELTQTRQNPRRLINWFYPLNVTTTSLHTTSPRKIYLSQNHVQTYILPYVLRTRYGTSSLCVLIHSQPPPPRIGNEPSPLPPHARQPHLSFPSLPPPAHSTSHTTSPSSANCAHHIQHTSHRTRTKFELRTKGRKLVRERIALLFTCRLSRELMLKKIANSKGACDD